jgi:MinD superfamily P-loop ATPase
MKIAIASGKGGTGKTTLAVNLATYLAESKEVVLADLDVEEPNAKLFIPARLVNREDQFQMVPRWDEDHCTLCGLCQEVCNFNAVIQLSRIIMIFPELCHGCYACSELCPVSALPMIPKKIGELGHFEDHKMSFVESRLAIGQEQGKQLISKTIDYIDAHWHSKIVKIYDAPPGTSCPVIEVTRNADFVILVTEPTPFGMHDLKLAVKTVEMLDRRYGVVVNRYGIGNEEVVRYCNSNGIPVLAFLPNDRRIAEMYSCGKLIHKAIPGVAQQLDKIWEYISKSFSNI